MLSFSAFKNKFIYYFLKNVIHLRLPADIIRFGIQRYGEKCLFEVVGNQQSIYYKDFKLLINCLTDLINALDIPRQSVIACMNVNPIAYYTLRSVCHNRGYIFFALPPGLSGDAVLYFLKETNTKVICFEDIPLDAEQLLNDHLPDLKHLKLSTDISGKEAIPSDIKRQSGLIISDIATLNLSSGTTGRTPKIIQLSHQNWTSSVFNYILNTDSPQKNNIRFLCTLPCATAGSTSFLLTFLAGMTQIIAPPDLSSASLAEVVISYRVTSLFITPTNFYKFYYYSWDHQIKYPDLKQIIIGTEVASAWVISKAIAYFGPIIHISYGMVEVLPPLTMLSPKDYSHGNSIDTEKLKTVGKVLKGVTVRLSDSDGKIFTTPEKTGLVQIKGPTVSAGYLKDSSASDTSFQKGWFHSNDYGRFDKHGLLNIYGRKEDIVMERTERLVFASELENCIYETGLVRFCAVTSHQNRIGIVIVPDNLNNPEIENKINQKITQSIGEKIDTDILKQEEIPVTALGKLNRLKCKELIYG